MRLLMLTFCLLSLPCVFALATTYVVSPDGSGDFPTIQAAIDFSVDGDVIALTNGTFTGDGNRDVDYRGKAVTVRSLDGVPETCVIDCEGSKTDPHRGFYFRKSEQVESMLFGLTVRGGWAVHPDFGGAVRCDGGSSPTIESCVFSGNSGSAVGCGAGTFLPIGDCRFAENEGTYGGAIYADRSSLVINHCRFTENRAENDGGAIFTYGTLAKIMHSAFVGNASHSAAAASFHDGSEANVLECLFQSNVSSSSGGALTFWISGPNLVDWCTFAENVAGYEGAALWSEKISATFVRNCTFWGNASPDGTVLAGNHQFIMVNTVVAAGAQGPGVASHEGYAELACCDIFGNAGGDWVGTIADQYGVNGNICEDPLFCDPENGVFELDAASPCAPFSSAHPDCDLVGAWPVGCGVTPVAPATWGRIKALYGADSR
jgi:predicted outer membrane repeat protein